MLTIAQQISHKVRDGMSFADATNEATRLAESTDQNWDAESTTFNFPDGSILQACYPFVEVAK